MAENNADKPMLTKRKQVNHSESKSYKDLRRKDKFDVRWGEANTAWGKWIEETLTIAENTTLKKQAIGLTGGQGTNGQFRTAGVLGLGLSSGIHGSSPSFIESLLAAEDIYEPVFSMYFNDLKEGAGSLLLGGIDADKYIGELKKVDTVPYTNVGYIAKNDTQYNLNITKFSIHGMSVDSFEQTVALDSASPVSLLPESVVGPLHDRFSVVNLDSGLYGLSFVECDTMKQNGKVVLEFELGHNQTIKVGSDQLVLDIIDKDTQEQLKNSKSDLIDGKFKDMNSICIFTVSSPERVHWGDHLLGTDFMRSAYIAYYPAKKELGIAQANLESNSSRIVIAHTFIDDGDVPNINGVNPDEGYEGDMNFSNAASGRNSAFALPVLVAGLMALL